MIKIMLIYLRKRNKSIIFTYTLIKSNMKLQDLKDNREQIIETITSLFGKSNLNSAMNILKDKAEYSEMFEPSMTINEAIEDLENNSDLFEERKMTLADYISGLTDNDSKTYALSWMNK